MLKSNNYKMEEIHDKIILSDSEIRKINELNSKLNEYLHDSLDKLMTVNKDGEFNENCKSKRVERGGHK